MECKYIWYFGFLAQPARDRKCPQKKIIIVMTATLSVHFHTEQLEFQPKYEWALGNRIKHPETTQRAASIFREVKKFPQLFSVNQPPRIPLSALRETHSYQLLMLYNTASSLSENTAFYPSVFPQRKSTKPDPTNLLHAGFYCFDSGTPLNRHTWTAAAWSAASAYYAAQEIAKEQASVSYSLSRPPGHHASRVSYGGYCYFNNAAIAAKVLRRKGRVVVLDIDFHHGNGTQDIFYNDDRCFVISLHGDPRKYFPFFMGFPSETGAGKGTGFNLNVLTEDGCTLRNYLKSLRRDVIPAIQRFEAEYLVISAGFDTYEKDPIGRSALRTEDYFELGQYLRKLKLPTVIVQEGGYFASDLGANVVSFLKAFV